MSFEVNVDNSQAIVIRDASGAAKFDSRWDMPKIVAEFQLSDVEIPIFSYTSTRVAIINNIHVYRLLGGDQYEWSYTVPGLRDTDLISVAMGVSGCQFPGLNSPVTMPGTLVLDMYASSSLGFYTAAGGFCTLSYRITNDTISFKLKRGIAISQIGQWWDAYNSMSSGVGNVDSGVYFTIPYSALILRGRLQILRW